MNISVRLPGPAVERAERADDVADVCVIDVAVDDVRDDIGRVLPHPDLVGREPDPHKIVRFQKRRAVLGRQSLAFKYTVQNRLYWLIHRSYSTKGYRLLQKPAGKQGRYFQGRVLRACLRAGFCMGTANFREAALRPE